MLSIKTSETNINRHIGSVKKRFQKLLPIGMGSVRIKTPDRAQKPPNMRPENNRTFIVLHSFSKFLQDG